MATRNIVLTSEQSDFVDQLVGNGRFQNASEALRAGLRLLEHEEAETAELRHRLLISLEQMHKGELAEGTGEDVIRRAFNKARPAS
jgi:antitoxin ParD1/3/4